MTISTPQDREPTPQELQELENLKAIIERATEDGKLTEVEFASIKDAIRTDRKVSIEELQLVRELIDEKIARGELEKF